MNKNNKQILLLYHIKNREYIINQMMRDCLIEAGETSEIIICEAYDMINNLYDYNPKCVISFLPRDEYGTALYTMVKKIFNCLWIAIPTEGFMPLTDESINILLGLNDQPRKLVDYYCFWGRGMYEVCKEKLVEREKISCKDRVKVFGYLPYEARMIRKYTKHEKIHRLIENRINNYDKVILFVTGIMAYIPTVEDRRQESGFDYDNLEEYAKAEEDYKWSCIYADAYIDQIYKSAIAFPNYLFIVKRHPVEDGYQIPNGTVSRYDKLREINNILFVDEPIQISSIFRYTDIFIHYGSTTSLEAYVYKVPSITLYNNDEPQRIRERNTYYRDANYYIDVKDTDGLKKIISSNLVFERNKIMEEKLYNYMNYEYDKNYQPSILFEEIMKKIDYTPQKLDLDRVTLKYLKSDFNRAVKKTWIKNGIVKCLEGKPSALIKAIIFYFVAEYKLYHK